MTYIGPFYVVTMPVNKEGHGPEMDESKVVVTYYEVWDQSFLSVGSFTTRDRAFAICNVLNGREVDESLSKPDA